MVTSPNDSQEVQTTLQVTTPSDKNLVAMANGLLSVAEAYNVTTPQMYALAADDLQQIKSRITTLDEQRKSITRPIDEAKEKVMSLFRGPVETLKRAEQIIKTAMVTFDNEQERLRREREEELRREQEAEQRRIADAAEAARVAAQAAQDALALAATPEEVAAAEVVVQQTAAAVEVVEERKAEVQHAPAPIVTSATPKVTGISRKTTWRAECTDKLALIKAVADGKAPITLIDVNESVLNQMARALKETLDYPGCRAIEETSIASSRRS